METPPIPRSPYEIMREKNLEALRSVAEKFGLKILRDDKFNNTDTLVVEDGYGEEVHIGFPDRMDILAATGKIRGVKMYSYGHGSWLRGTDLVQKDSD